MAQYLDYAGLQKVLGKIDDTFAKKTFLTYTQEEADAINAPHLIDDPDGNKPGDEGYVPTYSPDDYVPVKEGDAYEVKIEDLDSEQSGKDDKEFITVKVKQVDGLLDSVEIATNDIASASVLADLDKEVGIKAGEKISADDYDKLSDEDKALYTPAKDEDGQPTGEYESVGSGLYKYIDEEIAAAAEEASKTTVSKDIEILGGPLANDVDESNDEWPSDWVKGGKKVIPEGASLQEILENLFFKVKFGTLADAVYTWSPSLTNAPTAALSATGDAIVGTELTATFGIKEGVSGNTASASVSISDGFGYSTDGSTVTSGSKKTVNASAGSTSGTLAATATWKGGDSATAASVATGDAVVVGYGKNTLAVSQSGLTATPGSFTETTVYNVTNTGTVKTDDSKVINQAGFEASTAYGTGSKTLAAKTAKAEINGYYPYYSGLLTEAFGETITGDDLKAYEATKACPTSVTTLDTSKGYFVAVPATAPEYSYDIVKLLNDAKTNFFGVASSVGLTLVEVNVAGDATQDYKVFTFCNAAQWNKAESFPNFEWSAIEA